MIFPTISVFVIICLTRTVVSITLNALTDGDSTYHFAFVFLAEQVVCFTHTLIPPAKLSVSSDNHCRIVKACLVRSLDAVSTVR